MEEEWFFWLTETQQDTQTSSTISLRTITKLVVESSIFPLEQEKSKMEHISPTKAINTFCT